VEDLDFPEDASFGVYSGTSELGRPLYLCGKEFVYDNLYGNRYQPQGPIPPREVFEDSEDGMPVPLKDKWWRPSKDAIDDGFGRQDVKDYYWEMVSFSPVCSSLPGLTLRSHCGSMFVKIVHNGTGVNDVEVKMSYEWYKTLKKEREPWDVCFDHPFWEPAPVIEEATVAEQIITMVAFVFGGLFLLVGLGGAYYYFEVYLPNSEIQTNSNLTNNKKPVKAKKIPHGSFNPILNALMNRFLLKVGECTICFGDDEKVFKLPGCEHMVCIDCLRSYVHTALGDASMFPIKCPMHHTGCLTVLESKFAQRVLNKDEFERFNLFNDRAVYGDGMACIFCGNFVIFPERMGGVMVACPYCRQRFCMKCKVAWHVGVDCTETGKDELEDWRRSHGATRCPGCFKIIEKDDPETCNHMVHKATDSIPCIQERTDFCYCCGLEVTPDYPHYEAVNPSVNHFPDGVYNDCRVVLEGFSVAIGSKPSTQRRHGAGGRRNTTGGNRAGAAAGGRRMGGAANRLALVVPVEEDIEAPAAQPAAAVRGAGERYEYRVDADVDMAGVTEAGETQRRRDRNTALQQGGGGVGAGAGLAAVQAVNNGAGERRRHHHHREHGEGRGEGAGPQRRLGAQGGGRRHSTGTTPTNAAQSRVRRAHHHAH
jgi:hypothetical protein